MPKQRITFQRAETVTVEFDYAVDTHTKANAEYWANYGFFGGSSISKIGDASARILTEWKMLKSEPPACTCAETIAKSLRAQGSAKRKG